VIIVASAPVDFSAQNTGRISVACWLRSFGVSHALSRPSDVGQSPIPFLSFGFEPIPSGAPCPGAGRMNREASFSQCGDGGSHNIRLGNFGQPTRVFVTRPCFLNPPARNQVITKALFRGIFGWLRSRDERGFGSFSLGVIDGLGLHSFAIDDAKHAVHPEVALPVIRVLHRLRENGVPGFKAEQY